MASPLDPASPRHIPRLVGYYGIGAGIWSEVEHSKVILVGLL